MLYLSAMTFWLDVFRVLILQSFQDILELLIINIVRCCSKKEGYGYFWYTCTATLCIAIEILDCQDNTLMISFSLCVVLICLPIPKWLVTGLCFSTSTPISSTNIQNISDEILLKVALNTLTLTQTLITINWTVGAQQHIFCQQTKDITKNDKK